MTSQKEDNKITSVMTRCIQHSILNLCNEHISFCRTLHVLGVLSLTIDSKQQEIIIKINDTLRKVDSPGSDEDTEVPVDCGTEALTDSGNEAPVDGGSGEEVDCRPIDIEPCNNALVNPKVYSFVQSDTSDISLEDQRDPSQRDVDEASTSILKMRAHGRKQRRPLKLNKNMSSVIDNKPADDDNKLSHTDDNNQVHNINLDDVTNNNQSQNVGSDNLAQNKNDLNSIVSDDAIENKSITSQSATDCLCDEPTLLAIDLIKREHLSPSLLQEESKDIEIQMNDAIDCSSKSAQLPKHFQTEDNRNRVYNAFHKTPVVEVFPDEKWQSDEPDNQPLSVRKLLTSNCHRPLNSMIEHLEKIAAFGRHGNFCLEGRDNASARTRLLMSQSRTLMSQISSEMPKPIVIEPIYRQAATESYQHLQSVWGCNNVQETPLNFSIQALNGEAEKDRQSPKDRNQQSSFQLSPSYKHNVERMPNPYRLNLSGHPDRPGEIRHASVQPTSLAHTGYVYNNGGNRLPSYDMQRNDFQSFFKRTDNDINASNTLLTHNVNDELGGNGLRSAGFGSLFARNAAMFQNSHRLHPRRALPGSLAWCPDKTHQKRIRKAIVNSNKGRKVTNEDMINKDMSHDAHRSPQQKSSSKIEGQYLVDSMSPETTRKRRRRGLDEALTADEIAEYMGVETDGTTPSSFACKYCTEESQDLCAYLSHTVTVHGSYICHQCAKIFTTKSSLLRHRPIHTGMRRFTCSICQRSFYRKDKCKAHIKKHLEMTGNDSESNRQEIINGFQLAPPINNSIFLPAPILSLAV